jgi:hypothetical protein
MLLASAGSTAIDQSSLGFFFVSLSFFYDESEKVTAFGVEQQRSIRSGLPVASLQRQRGQTS